MAASPQAMVNPPLGPRTAEEGEWVSLPMSDDQKIIDTEDGGADVILEKAGSKSPTADEQDFYENLVDLLPSDYLETKVSDMLDAIDIDKRSREKRDEQYAEGLKRTGAGKDAPGGAEFEGASKAVHPMIMKAAVDFGARAMKEIFPAQGPAKSFIPGRVTKDRVEKATRLTRYFNWLTTTRMPEFRPGLEQVCTQSSVSGVQYLRFRWSGRLKRQESKVVYVDNLFLPYEAANLYSAERITYQDDITELEYKNRIREGIYRDVDIVPPSMMPTESKSAEARAKAEGKQPEPYNRDGVRRTYETSTFFDDLESKLVGGSDYAELDMALPYIVFIDESSRCIAGIYRNWEKGDERYERMHWIVEFPFIPWTGAYAIGLIQAIGSLSAAATGALRALLDAGHISNQNTSYVLKGPNVSGQSQQTRVAQQNFVKGGVGGDDIRKLLYPVQPQAPSITLFNLLQFIVQEGGDVVRTVFESLSENNPNAPVGTTYALIEQGLAVVGSIIGRFHFAMSHVLNILRRIARMYVTDDEVRNEAGEMLAYRADFQGPNDVIPVSDPGIPSDSHRMAQMQTVAQRADMKPYLYNQRRVEKMILERLRIQDPDSFLIPMAEPEEMNAANENVATSFGKPITAYPHQDHLAHIQTHLGYCMSPVLGSNPLLAPKVIPPMLDHLSQHMSLWYLGRVYAIVKLHLPGQLEDYMEISDDAVKAEIDRTIAKAAEQVTQESVQKFQQMGLPQAVQQLQALMKQFMPPQPMDPSQAQLQKAQMDNTTRQQIAAGQQQTTLAAKDKDLQGRMQQANMQVVAGREKVQADLHKTAITAQAGLRQEGMQQQGENQRKLIGGKQDAAIAAYQEEQQNARQEQSDLTKERINLEDNQTAIQISNAEIAAGKHSPLTNGRGIGRDK